MSKEEKELDKLKSIIKKLKKKKKKRARKAASMEQKVTQKIIFQKGSQESNSRPFPQILQQHIPSSDTEFLRSVIMQQNNSPLTRPVVSRVRPRPSYDLADQQGLNLFQPFMGITASSQQPTMQPTMGITASSQPIKEEKNDDYSDYENVEETVLQTPTEKQPYIPDEISTPPEIDIKPKRTYKKSDAQIEKERKAKEEKEMEKEQKKLNKYYNEIAKRRRDSDMSPPWK